MCNPDVLTAIALQLQSVEGLRGTLRSCTSAAARNNPGLEVVVTSVCHMGRMRDPCEYSFNVEAADGLYRQSLTGGIWACELVVDAPVGELVDPQR